VELPKVKLGGRENSNFPLFRAKNGENQAESLQGKLIDERLEEEKNAQGLVFRRDKGIGG